MGPKTKVQSLKIFGDARRGQFTVILPLVTTSLSPQGFPNIPHALSSPHKYSASRVHKYSKNPAEIQIQYSSRALPCSPYDCPVLPQLPKKTHCFLPKNYPQTASSYTHLCPISLEPTLFDA